MMREGVKGGYVAALASGPVKSEAECENRQGANLSALFPSGNPNGGFFFSRTLDHAVLPDPFRENVMT